MKATSFLNCDEVIVKTEDGTWYKLGEKESKNWISGFLYWVAGLGKDPSFVKDGKIEGDKFITFDRTYYPLIPHKEVHN